MKALSFVKNIFRTYQGRSVIIKKSLTYISSDIINKILPFLLLPIITRYLSPSDYGTLSVFDSIVGFLAVFVGLGSQEMVTVNYFKIPKEELKNYIGNVFIITLLTSLLYLLIFFTFKSFFLNEYGLGFIWLFFAVYFTFCEFFKKIISIIWIAEGSSFTFAKFQNLSSLITILTTLFFVVLLEMSWQGRIYSLILSTTIFASIAFYYINKNGYFALQFNLKALGECMKESMGVLPYSVSFWFKNLALLILMATFIGKSETGLYASAMRIAIIVSFAANSINKVWKPMLFEMLAKEKINKKKAVKSIYLYMLIIIAIGLGIFIFSGLIVKLALAPAYHSATIYVRFLVVAITMQSLFTAMADFLIFHKKSKNLTFVSISGIIIQYLIIFIFYYLGNLNVMNIIYAIMISGFFTLALSWYMATKARPLPWLFFIKSVK